MHFISHSINKSMKPEMICKSSRILSPIQLATCPSCHGVRNNGDCDTCASLTQLTIDGMRAICKSLPPFKKKNCQISHPLPTKCHMRIFLSSSIHGKDDGGGGSQWRNSELQILLAHNRINLLFSCHVQTGNASHSMSDTFSCDGRYS